MSSETPFVPRGTVADMYVCLYIYMYVHISIKNTSDALALFVFLGLGALPEFQKCSDKHKKLSAASEQLNNTSRQICTVHSGVPKYSSVSLPSRLPVICISGVFAADAYQLFVWCTFSEMEYLLVSQGHGTNHYKTE